MKLDKTTELDNNSPQVLKQKTSALQNKDLNLDDLSSSLIEMLNPLKDVNLLANLHSFGNFSEVSNKVKKILSIQSNIMFYVLHQTFMEDEAHKEFFKNIVGRFYDLPEWAWDYYQGQFYRNSNDFSTVIGLILLENNNFYKKTNKYPALRKKHFITVESSKYFEVNCYNKLALEEYWGNYQAEETVAYYAPFNKYEITDRDISNERSWEAISFDNEYEFGRFQTDKFKIKRKTEDKEANYWFIASYNWIENNEEFEVEEMVSAYSVYASLGIDNFSEIIDAFKSRSTKFDIEWKDEFIPDFSESDKRIIRSLSQTFPWSKDYIMKLADTLNLDVLALNMTVPWDFELVKYFINNGYGNRLTENKAVFDRLFKPLLTDDILRKLFNCEFEVYYE